MPMSRIFNVANMSFNTFSKKKDSRENLRIYSTQEENKSILFSLPPKS